MSQISDLVHDSRLSTRFLSDNTIHTYFESTTVFNRRARRQKRVETWVRSKELGRGSFGIVWLEQCPREDRLRAVKEIAKKKIQENAYHRELEAIVKFSHARYDGLFVRSFGWYENPDSVFIAMEYILLGDLQKHLKRALPEDEAAQVVRQVLEGLECMHDNGFAHRDLKPENIFVVSKPPDKWWVKIGDFGISKRVAHGVTELRTINGTPGFIAPEVALKQLYEVDVDESSYDFTVDLWSLGVIAFYMLTTKHPFLKLESLISYARGDLAMSELCLKYSVINEEASSFLGRLMAPKAEDRGTATEALQHNWLPKDDESLPGSPQRHTPALTSPSLVPHKADACSESEPEVSTFTTMKSATRHTIRRDSSSESEPEVVRFTTMDQSAYDTSQSGYPSETGPEIPTEADTEAKVPEERPQSKEPVLQRAMNEGSGASTIRPKAQHPEEVSHDTKTSRTVRSGALPKERRRPPASQQPTSWISKLTSWKSPKTSLKSPMVSSEKSSKPDSPSNKQQPAEKTERVLRRRPKEPEGSLSQRHLEGPDSGEKPDHQWPHPNATRYIRESGSYGKIIKANNTEPTAIHVHSDSSVQQEPSNKLASRPKRPDTPPPPAVTAVRYANENTHPPAPVDPYAVDPYASYPVHMSSKTPEPSTTRSRRPDTPPPGVTAVGYANNTTYPPASIDPYAVDPYASYPIQVPSQMPEASILRPGQPDGSSPGVAPVQDDMNIRSDPPEFLNRYSLTGRSLDAAGYPSTGLQSFPAQVPPQTSAPSTSLVEYSEPAPSRTWFQTQVEDPSYHGESSSQYSTSTSSLSSTSDPTYEARRHTGWFASKPRQTADSFDQSSYLGPSKTRRHPGWFSNKPRRSADSFDQSSSLSPDNAIEMSNSSNIVAADTWESGERPDAHLQLPSTPAPSWQMGKKISSNLWLPHNGFGHSDPTEQGVVWAADPYISWERPKPAGDSFPGPDGYTRLPTRCYAQYALNEMGIRNFTSDGEEILVNGFLALELHHLLLERTCELRRRALHLQYDQPIPGWNDQARCCLAGRTVVRLENTSHQYRFPIAYMVEPERKSITLEYATLPPYSEIEIVIASPNGKSIRYVLLCDEIHPRVLHQHKIEFGFRLGRMFISGVFSAEQANSLIEETWIFLEDIYGGTQNMWSFSPTMGPVDLFSDNFPTPKRPQANQTLPSQGHPRRPAPFHPILARRWSGPRITAVDDTFDADSGFDPGVERHMQPQLQQYNPFGDIIFVSPEIPDIVGFAQFDRRSGFVEVERVYHAEYPHVPNDAEGCPEYERRYHRQNPWLYKKVPYNVPQVAQAGVDYQFQPSS